MLVSGTPRHSAGYPIAPTATIVPWPGMRRGTEATVPRPPGLVSVSVAPCSSSAVSVLLRARSISRSYSSRNSLNGSAAASRITGTISPREPSFRTVSTAMPRCAGPGNSSRLAVIGAREVSRHRAGVGGTRDGVANQVRERHLDPVARSCERLIQLPAAAVEDADADGAEGRRGRDVAAALHIVDKHRCRALDGIGVLAVANANAGVGSRSAAGLRDQHIALGDDASRAGAMDRVQIDAVACRSPAGKWRSVDIGPVCEAARTCDGGGLCCAWRRGRFV